MGELRARFLFNTRQQGVSESLEDYVRELSTLCSGCGYQRGENGATDFLVNRLIRDRLLAGIRNKLLPNRILELGDGDQDQDTSLEKAVDLLKAETEVIGLHIKQEEDEDGCLFKITEEAKIAILLELLNHKSVLTAPIGFEVEKADLWDQIYQFARDNGTSFKNTIHLREVFGSWKNEALKAKKDVKASNSDRLIWDLFGGGQDEGAASLLQDYPVLDYLETTTTKSSSDSEEEEEDVTYNEADLEYSSAEETKEEEKDTGRPSSEKKARRRSSGSVSGHVPLDLKLVLLKKLLRNRDIISCEGKPKEKVVLWEEIYNSLKPHGLTVPSVRMLRVLYRSWKTRALKKRSCGRSRRFSAAETLIYKIYGYLPIENADLSVGYDETRDDFEASENYEVNNEKCFSYVDASARIAILKEMAKHKHVVNGDDNYTYDKENMWEQIFQTAIQCGVKNLTIRKLKGLVRSWKTRAISASSKQGGPQSMVQKLVYYIYNLGPDYAEPPMMDLHEPVLPCEESSFTHYSAEAKKAILKEIQAHKHIIVDDSGDAGDISKDEAWNKVYQVAVQNGVENISKAKLKRTARQWKARAIKAQRERGKPKNEIEEALFDIYRLEDEYDQGRQKQQHKGDEEQEKNGNDEDLFEVELVQIPELVQLEALRYVKLHKKVLFGEDGQREMYDEAAQVIAKSGDCQISGDQFRRKFHQWKNMALFKNKNKFDLTLVDQALLSLFKDNMDKMEDGEGQKIIVIQPPTDVRLTVVRQVLENKNLVLWGSARDQTTFWTNLYDVVGEKGKFWDDQHLRLTFKGWKRKALGRLKKGHKQLTKDELAIVDIFTGNQTLTPSEYGLCDQVPDDEPSVESKRHFLEPLLVSESKKVELVQSIMQQYRHVFQTRGSWDDKLTYWQTLAFEHELNCDQLILTFRQWVLMAIRKQVEGLTLCKSDDIIIQIVQNPSNEDEEDAELLSLVQELELSRRQRRPVQVSDDLKEVIITRVRNHSDISSQSWSDKMSFWTDNCTMVNQQDNNCEDGQVLFKNFSSWTYKALLKKLDQCPTDSVESSLVQLVEEAENFLPVQEFENIESNLEVTNELVVPENVKLMLLEDVKDYHRLAIKGTTAQKCLFWTNCLFIAAWNGLKCDSAANLYKNFHQWKLNAMSKQHDNDMLTRADRMLLSIFDLKTSSDIGDISDNDQDYEEEEDVIDSDEDDTEDKPIFMHDDTKILLLKSLLHHKFVLMAQGKAKEKQVVWKKALTLVQGKGIKVEDLGKLQDTVNLWKQRTIKRSNECATLTKVDNLICEVFGLFEKAQQPLLPPAAATVVKQQPTDSKGIKRELEVSSDEDLPLSQTADFKSSLPKRRKGQRKTPNLLSDASKVAIARAMLKHKNLIRSLKHEEQDMGWHKVHRVAHVHGAIYESTSGLREHLRMWKSRSLAKLRKGITTVTELDKILYAVYDADVNGLNLEIIPARPSPSRKQFSKTNVTIASARITTTGRLAILHEMARNRQEITSDRVEDKYCGWKNVVRIANALGGSFESPFQLRAFVRKAWKVPALKKLKAGKKCCLQSDLLIYNVYGLDASKMEVEPESQEQKVQDKLYPCDPCSVTFMRFDELATHDQLVHGTLPELGSAGVRCQVCGQRFGLKPSLRSHLRDKHADEPFNCDLCDQMFISDDVHNQHAKTHYEQDTKDLPDDSEDDDDLDDNDDANVEAKAEFTSPVPMPKVTGLCPHCGESFRNVHQHIMYKHETKKPWKCDQCDYAHALQRGLLEHTRHAHPKDSDLKVCHICGYKTTLNHNLKEHIERTHEKKRRFFCNLCNAHFYRKNVMERHVRVKHMGEKPYKCPKCPLKFGDDTTMRRHCLQVHLKIKYTCELCNNDYSCKKTLWNHKRNVHKLEMPRLGKGAGRKSTMFKKLTT